ncbi:alpha-L-fucosidase [Microbacterium esteraromaticum]|uniref:alpha-L-fucosidase n=1 Tax=Microbacterium esteraromaticum TaxID=57043 RepID=UPI0019D35410|nr:alpha-L-fucosidase [Microbacterium esteraromaticum]MBN7793694.1 alpha-L-fucosidase [Microbacterium esteraromaticum]
MPVVLSPWTDRRRDEADARPVQYGPLVTRRDDEAMRRFRTYGLGQFIHFGLYSIPGNQWNGKTSTSPAPEWIRSWRGPDAPENWTETYDRLNEVFDPTELDARAWARQAKQMGARYVIFTTKHHDGFALWPSAYSEYTVASSPCDRDLVGEIVDAYTAEGIDVFLYFSVLDWSHPGYTRTVPACDDSRAGWQDFLDYTRAQLLELLDRYPAARGLWFDGTWDESWIASHEFTHRLEQELRERRPGLIIGSRLRNDEHGARHFDSTGALLGDYEQGWERKLPRNREMLDGNDWDCAMTIGPNAWGYMHDTSGHYQKTADDLVDLLMRCRSMGGNLVVNFGPDGSGRMTAHETRVAEQLGDWVAQNAAAVYDASHVDLEPTGMGHLTGNDDSVYVTVTHRPVTGVARLRFPADAALVPVAACLLATGAALELHRRDIGYDLDSAIHYDVLIPADFATGRAFVIELTLGQPTAQNADRADAFM